MRMELDSVPVDLSCDAKLIFRIKKTDGLWVIAAFDSIYEQDRIIPVYPNSQLNLPLGELKAFRQSYACMSYMISRNGRPIGNDFPGIDRPDLVEALYHEIGAWLYGN
ncbi:hypothetical protein REC12_08485 [Desulfosporosinus sp. PR]|nr:hypothetical protein [Desulfosporosinus sp. PR]